jgi:hypothetical protein
MLSLTQPIERAHGKLALELGPLYFEVTPSHGARVTSLRHDGIELLVQTGSENFADAFGSTFWPSPQRWSWPPPAEIDHGAYSASVDRHGVIRALGRPHLETGLTVAKKFSANLEREAIELVYAMTNSGREVVQWAPWEITRMPATGLAFWPTGSAPRGDIPMQSRVEHGHTWCDPSQTAGEGKLFADGAGGYLAYLVGDRLLIKQFEDQPASAAAPDEAEIELYVNRDHTYVEVENQGAYATIVPGQTLSWRVVWYVRRLPASVTPNVSCTDLIAFVAQTLE